MIKQELIGRNHDLSILKRAWSDVKNGTPCIFVMRADTGVGKTRLIQEFYHWLSAEQDDQDYWCDSLYDEKKAMSVVPSIRDLPLKEIPDLPWLWLATRCQAAPIPSGDAEVEVAFDAVRHQIAIHLAAIFRNQEKKSLNKNLAKAGFGLVASFALPGSGQLVEIFNTLLDRAGDTLSVADLYSAFKRKIKNIKADATSLSDIVRNEYGGVVDSAIKAFGALLESKNEKDTQHSTPIILFFDDAHYIDPVTKKLLDELFKAAEKKNWPLFLIISCWDESIRFKRSRSFNASLVELIEEWRKKVGSKNTVFIEHELAPLQLQDLSIITRSQIPGLKAEALEVLSQKSSGDIDLLFDFLDEMKQSPGWLNSDGSLAVDPTELEKLPSKAAEMARRRLNAAGEKIRETLTWASAQGYQFDDLIIKDLLHRLSREIDTNEALLEADGAYGFVKTNEHAMLSLTGEFRRLAYFDACKEFFVRHPKGQAYLTELACVLRDLRESQIWSELESDDKLRLGRRLLTLIDSLKLSGDSWIRLLNDLLKELSYIRLQLGDTYTAERYAERLLRTRSTSEMDKNEARKILVASAYMEGDADKESRRLAGWRRSNQGNTLDYFSCESLFAMRQGKLKRAIDMSRRAKALAKTTKEKVEGEISEAVALWASGSPESALKPLKRAESQLRGKDDEETGLVASLRHTCSLVLHDLEKNVQVMYHAKHCINHYERVGDGQQAIISRVNYGDAMWGVGLIEQAKTELQRAYNEASDAGFLHARDIAAICLGNVLQDNGQLEAAEKYYLEGIDVAKEIGHLWDQLYGEIYYESIRMRSDYKQGLSRLTALEKSAKREGYDYLSDLAAAMSAVARHRLGIRMRNGIKKNEESISTNMSPLARCHFAAEEVLGVENIDRRMVINFLEALGCCEGIKGKRDFVINAIDKIYNLDIVTEVEREFLRRWKGRFIWGTGVVPENITIVACDYRMCEARCCYDGVYLVGEEEEKIREIVKENPEFFSHLPKDYIIEDIWEGVSGIKTATRTHQYKSPDFPRHFNNTRCVFALQDGGCSLQVLAEKMGKPSWEYKPISCVMHPLSVRNENVLAPPGLGQKDESFVDVDYPGYASFTPCGQPRSDGQAWTIVFGEEINAWKRRFREHAKEKE